MSLLVKGITKLSQLEIDADKDWLTKAINNPGNVDGVDLSAHVADPDAHHSEEVAEARPKYGATELLTIPGVAFSSLSTLLLTATALYYFPFIVRTPITVTQMTIDVTTAAAGKAVRVGIYRADKNWQPTSLVSAAGTLSVNAIAVVSLTGLSIPLQEGNYLIAMHSEGAPTLRVAKAAIPFIAPYFGVTSILLFMATLKAYAVLTDPGTPWDIANYSTTTASYPVLLAITP